MGTIDDVLAEATEDLSESRVTQRTAQINLNGALPLSDILRDETQTSGTGAVTDATSEFRVRHQASGDFSRLASAGRGDYEPGFVMEAGIGIRLDSVPTTGDFKGVWGYFDMQLSGGSNTENIKDGLLFGVDASGTYVQIIKNGTSKLKVYEDSWNGADIDLDLTKGYVFQIDFLYYGYGLVTWKIVDPNDDSALNKVKIVHSATLSKETTLASPNLQVGTLVDSTNTTDDFSVYVGGRQVSVVGRYQPKGRVGAARVEGASVGTSFEPILSLRKKDNFRQIVVDLLSYEVNSDEDAVVQVRVNADITGGTAPSFGSLQEQADDQTALELDTSATAIDTSTGVKVFESIISGGSGADKQALSGINDIPTVIPDEATVTFAMKSLGTTATVDFLGRLVERW